MNTASSLSTQAKNRKDDTSRSKLWARARCRCNSIRSVSLRRCLHCAAAARSRMARRVRSVCVVWNGEGSAGADADVGGEVEGVSDEEEGMSLSGSSGEVRTWVVL